MSTGTRHPYALMTKFSAALWTYLASLTNRIDVAGSIRRLDADPYERGATATCGDIELVLGDVTADEVRALLIAKPDAFPRVTGGERLIKTDWHVTVKGVPYVIPVQLNLATTLNTLEYGTLDNYGWKLILATGDAEFNHLLVTPRLHGGLKPRQLNKAQAKSRFDGFWHQGDTPLSTPTEADVFTLFGLPYIPPHQRTAATVAHLRADLQTQGGLTS